MPSENRTDRVRVALVVPTLCHGGAERQVIAMARYLDPDEYEAYIITFSDFTPILDPDDPLRQRLIVVPKRFRFDLSVFWRLLKTLRDLRVDIVHSFHFDAEIVCRLVGRMAGAKVLIGSERNCDYHISRWRWLFNWLTLKRADLIIANSRSGAEFHEGLYRGRQKNYAVVYNGVDTDHFHVSDKGTAKRKIGYKQSDIVLGMFASFKPQKNHVNLILALNELVVQLDNLKLLLVGDTLVDNYANTSEYKAGVLDKLGKSDVGSITNNLGNQVDLQPLYSACDVTVLPSLHEGTPNVVLESMACGVPVVLTNVADNSILVQDGIEGLLVERDDVCDLRDKLAVICNDEDLRNRMSQAAREGIVERMSNEKMGIALGRVYADLIGADSAT